MKRFIFIFTSIFLLPLLSIAQTIEDEIFTSSSGMEFSVGDDLIIGYPSLGAEFSFIENNTKKKIGLAGKLAGAVTHVATSVAVVGVGSGSFETVATGVQAAGTASAVEGVAKAGDLIITGENKLTGQRLRVLKFFKKGNPKRGEHFYATVAGIGKENYDIELDRAIDTQEVLGVNGELFTEDIEQD